MDYIAESQRITKAFLTLVIDTDDWKEVKNSDGVKVFSRHSEDPKVGNVYKCEVTLDAPAAKVYAAVNPSKQYRVQWDGFLEKLEVVKKIDENVHLIHHLCKSALKGIMSPRDSIDIVTTGETEYYYYVAAGGVLCPEVPVNPRYVRVMQYACGYTIFKNPNEPEKCRFVVLLKADFKMNMVASFVADVAKPTLMCQQVNHLRDGLSKLDIVYP